MSSPESTSQISTTGSILDSIRAVSVPLRIGYIVIWQLIVGIAALLGALILLTPDTFGDGEIVETLTTFSSSRVFRWTPSTGFIDGVLIVAFVAYGGTLLWHIPGLLQYKGRARLTSLALLWIGVLLSGSFMIRQMTVNQDTLLRAIDNQPAETSIGFFEDTLLIDRIGQGLEVFWIVLLFGLAALFLFNRHISNLFHETIQQREAIYAYLYLSPYLLIASIFTIGLLILAFYLSFNDLDLFSKAEWTGFNNYENAFEDTRFLISIANVIWYALIVVVFQTIIALILAVLMNDSFVGRRIFRTMFYAPSVTSPIVISLIFLWLFNGRGFINQIVFNTFDARAAFQDMGVEIRQESGIEWYQTPNRLGDMLYLRPFFSDTWGTLFLVGVVVLLVLMAARFFIWFRRQSYTLEQVQYTFGATALVTVGTVVIGALIWGFNDFEEVVRALPMYTLAGMIVGVFVINRIAAGENLDQNVHSIILANSVWATLVILIVFALGGSSNGLSFGVRAIGWCALGLLLSSFFASTGYKGPRTVAQQYVLARSNKHDVSIQDKGDILPIIERIARFSGISIPVLLLLFIAISTMLAAETAGYSRGSEMPDERFAALVARGPSIAFMTIMAQNIFTTAPTFMLLYLAALQDIPRHLYEAAQIDGATRFQRFLKVTVPMLRPVTLLIVVLSTIGTFQLFDQVAILTAGAPSNTTMVPVYLIYSLVLGDQRQAQVGYASAMAFILGAIIFFFTFIQRRYIESGTEQQ